MTQNLNLAEKFFLLAIDDKSGKFVIYNAKERIKWGIAGGLLISLVKLQKIGYNGKFIRLTDPTPTDDPLLNEVLELIMSSPKNKSVDFWLDQIVLEIKDLYEITVDRLVEKKILTKTEKPVKFGTRTIFKIQDPYFKNRMIPRLKEYLSNERRPSFPYRGLICLIASCGLYKIFASNGWDVETTRDVYNQFQYVTREHVKKYNFLDNLNEEITAKTRMHVYA